MLLEDAKEILKDCGYLLERENIANNFDLRDIKNWISANTKYKAFIKDMGISKQKNWNHEDKMSCSINLTHTPVPTKLTIDVYQDGIYAYAEGEDFATKAFKIYMLDDLKQVISALENCFSSLDESFNYEDYEGDIYVDIEDELEYLGLDANEIAQKMTDYADLINDWIEEGLSAKLIASKLEDYN